ncbi:hypothetical protein LSH36_146g00024 [Paralvinella palmiformis]|uniref:E3 ubiquitin-protein ligase listerin n=1 Tax=Paralvinella palmiformis TaxID=53620 RepID=A0AAD9JVI0_9ANNE|nr:hypothetical protein LSH36_146g00024 [Paralvinella palmiformis]
MATRRMCWHGHKEIHGISTKKPNHSTTLFAPALGDEFTKIYSVLSGNEELHNSSAYTSSLNMSMSIGEPLASSSPKATDNNVIIKNTSSKVIRDGIRILNMNCQSIKHNKDEMAVTIDSSEPDVIMFTVTWLHPSIKKNEFLPDTYEVHRRDQPTAAHGGPSSSARAAELLVCGSQSSSSLGFVGFDSLPDGLGYVPAAASIEEFDNSINGDFRIVLRKLSKKDATTKLKALQEFSSLCQEKDIEDIKSVLPFWPRVYNKVAIDHDRRVREAAQQAFEQLVLQIQRNLAPYLKSIMGTCKNIGCGLPTSCRTTDAENMEAKYNRVLCASLNALKTFLSIIPSDHQRSLVNNYKLILDNNRFWKYSKHQQTMIQGSFYGVLSALCQHQPDLAREFSSKISAATLHNLDNTDPLVCRTLWEAVLYTTSTLVDCWKHVNLKKGVLPGLWRLLCDGGSGSASVIYPNLLPFISQLPFDLSSDDDNFYRDFFDKMKRGPIESDAIVLSFMECLQYALSRKLTDALFIDFIVNDELIPLLMASLLEDSLPVYSSLYQKMVDLLVYLNKSSTEDDTERATAALATLSTIIESLRQLDIIEKNNEKCIRRYAAFLCTFKDRNSPRLTKTVRFSGTDAEKPVENARKSPLTFQQILDLVCDVCIRAYEQSLAHRSVATVEFFNEMIKAYDVDNIYNIIWKMSCLEILGDVIVPWIVEYGDMIQNKRIYEAFCIQDLSMLHLFLQAVYSQNTDKDVRSWFRGDQFGQRIVDITKMLCHQCSTGDGDISDMRSTDCRWQLLKLAFASDDAMEPLLDEKYLSVILGEIHATLPSPNSMIAGCYEKIRRTWEKGVEASLNQRGGVLCDNGFFNDAAKYIKSCLLEERCTFDRLQTLVNVTFSLAQCIGHRLKEDDVNAALSDSAVLAFLNQLYQPMTTTGIPQWQTLVVLKNELTLESLPKMAIGYKLSAFIPRCIVSTTYTAQILSAV